MRQLLVINPNTSHSVSALLQTHAQAAAGPQVRVNTVTARFGAPYIACEASYAVASHALLDRWAVALQDNPQAPDAILIGCFGDPGLLALRQGSAAPVTGLAEAAFAEAAALGRFAVVTGGERWKPMLERLAYSLGHAPALVGIHTVAPSGAELANDPQAAVALLTKACQEAAAQWQAQSIVLGGAGLAGLAALIQPHVHIPVIDSVLAGTRHALALPPSPNSENGFDVPWFNLAPELMALGSRNKLQQV
ncbi:aspartate/glutamate racemase family protein [Rhodoferax saidenbachensis]|uniref:Asp/Glu/hydantoin racemase n=1 Tax=Rhodoferax saidenbachensis TaxID=1484693 RepID=A0ABU1ZQ89_9BURK|nr:aspartate/glutamate racemase family protein [Rhodoferax saidenbachensis]MDR7307548.1 Asp/Glu/hydantoin racemase [Rhodoferax saidenbachensis]